jgi:hypothetical protein
VDQHHGQGSRRHDRVFAVLPFWREVRELLFGAHDNGYEAKERISRSFNKLHFNLLLYYWYTTQSKSIAASCFVFYCLCWREVCWRQSSVRTTYRYTYCTARWRYCDVAEARTDGGSARNSTHRSATPHTQKEQQQQQENSFCVATMWIRHHYMTLSFGSKGASD